ncbi:hypothetical protein K474DRAFT_1774105 [Panus rudis PR-1116 ss-1]|nr:hypothetical protein K474DRAFT_1774105 [Panus rudis PR-1116 ss-1]
MSDSSDQTDSSGITAADYNRLYIENFCILASSVLLFYDCILTFPTEVQRIWKRKFSGATIIYVLTRYAAVVERVVLTVSLFLQATEDKVRACFSHLSIQLMRRFAQFICVAILRLDDTLTDLSYATAGGFIALRLLGIYGSWTPTIIVGVFWVTRIARTLAIQITYTPIAFGPPLFGCGAAFGLEDTTLFAVAATTNSLVLASDAILLVLTWAKTLQTWRTSRGVNTGAPLASLLLRDGTVYFGIIFVFQVLAIVSSQVSSSFILWDVWVYFAQV